METQKKSVNDMIVYQNILLDAQYNDYKFVNPLPVVLSVRTRMKVGEAILRKSGKSLYCELKLDPAGSFDAYYAHAPFTIYGIVYAIVLSTTEHHDRSIKSLGEQTNIRLANG